MDKYAELVREGVGLGNKHLHSYIISQKAVVNGEYTEYLCPSCGSKLVIYKDHRRRMVGFVANRRVFEKCKGSC